MIRLFLILAVIGSQTAADTVVATRTIRPQQILTMADVRLVDQARREGAHSTLEQVIGLEARVAIYPGRAVMRGSLSAPALIDRNQVVALVFERTGLRIVAEGRALGRGGSGDRIRVMNIESRTVLFGTITPNGTVKVTQ